MSRSQAWELSVKTQISAAVKPTFHGEREREGEKKIVRGEKKSGVQKKTKNRQTNKKQNRNNNKNREHRF